jgi:hypothetical protein
MGCLPTWKKRFFVLKGAYLFRYEGEGVSTLLRYL